MTNEDSLLLQHLHERLHELEQKVGRIASDVAELRARAGIPLKRGKCPHCGAPTHPAAKACGACGRSWGRSEPDPKRGLPT